MRAILLMGIGLYTSRIILRVLGVTDFGIYNAVGGIVAMFGFISSSLSNATSRFITIAIGQGNQGYINRTFGTIKYIYYLLCILVVLLAETVGLWFLYTKMTIPSDRMDATFWVFQYSILSTVIGFICVPYNSAIIAHERMSAFAYISLFDAILKLLICFLLQITPYDKLVVYATLLFFVEIIDRIIYAVYCSKHFEEVRAPAKLDRKQLKEILTMSGWTLSGNIFWILNTQGVNLILNVFFGPVINAARGIALQVQGVMGQFVLNFQTAINPQITKSCSQDNYKRMGELLLLSSKFSYFLLFLMSLPVFLEAPFILNCWLGTVPSYTVVFLRIVLICALISSLSNPLWISILAVGELKKYMIWDNTIQFLVLPSLYFSFRFLDGNPEWAFIVIGISSMIGLIVRAWITLPLIHYSRKEYIWKVILPLSVVTLISPILPFFLRNFILSPILNFFFVIMISFSSSGVVIFMLGLTKEERSFIANKIYSIFK